MNISLINTIQVPDKVPLETHWLEQVGDACIAPGRLFFGRWYEVEPLSKDQFVLKSTETFHSVGDAVLKTAAIILLPLSAISIAFGLGAKSLAHRLHPALEKKYSFPTFINARTGENFAGRLPPNPLTPNCVNSQEKSYWGDLYDADPIPVPVDFSDPVSALKNLLQTAKIPNFDPARASLIEESDNYLHYTYTVVIPSGPMQGTYIDDVDIYYNQSRRCFEIRSASRVGFRDAVHLDFQQPGANKKRVEAIRQMWNGLTL